MAADQWDPRAAEPQPEVGDLAFEAVDRPNPAEEWDPRLMEVPAELEFVPTAPTSGAHPVPETPPANPAPPPAGSSGDIVTHDEGASWGIRQTEAMQAAQEANPAPPPPGRGPLPPAPWEITPRSGKRRLG